MSSTATDEGKVKILKLTPGGYSSLRKYSRKNDSALQSMWPASLVRTLIEALCGKDTTSAEISEMMDEGATFTMGGGGPLMVLRGLTDRREVTGNIDLEDADDPAQMMFISEKAVSEGEAQIAFLRMMDAIGKLVENFPDADIFHSGEQRSRSAIYPRYSSLTGEYLEKNHLPKFEGKMRSIGWFSKDSSRHPSGGNQIILKFGLGASVGLFYTNPNNQIFKDIRSELPSSGRVLVMSVCFDPEEICYCLEEEQTGSEIEVPALEEFLRNLPTKTILSEVPADLRAPFSQVIEKVRTAATQLKDALNEWSNMEVRRASGDEWRESKKFKELHALLSFIRG